MTNATNVWTIIWKINHFLKYWKILISTYWILTQNPFLRKQKKHKKIDWSTRKILEVVPPRIKNKKKLWNLKIIKCFIPHPISHSNKFFLKFLHSSTIPKYSRLCLHDTLYRLLKKIKELILIYWKHEVKKNSKHWMHPYWWLSIACHQEIETALPIAMRLDG